MDRVAQLAAFAEPVDLAGGEVLFEQGESGDALYLVVSGRLRVLVDSGEAVHTVADLVPGETVGEMALLAGEPRSATVVAVRDSRLMRVTREGFEAACAQGPETMLAITRELVQRLRRANTGPPAVAPPATIALVALTPGPEFDRFGVRLEAALGRLASVRRLTRAEAAGRGGAELAAWLDGVEKARAHVLYQAEAGDEEWSRLCLRQADLVLLVASAGRPAQAAPAARPGPAAPRRELVLLHPTGRLAGAAWPAVEVAGHHHVREHEAADYSRLARVLTGRAVGLALGGGGARGFAHLGVLRAARELGVPIDATAGTSIGSIIGGLAAMELDGAEMRRLCRRWIADADLLAEKQLPLVSLVSPRRFDRSLAALFGEVLIEDLPIPYFCVSADLTKAEPVVHDQGLLRQAVRASGALPGILPPVVREGGLLVDGGVLNNLPGDLLRARRGCRVVACDASPRRDLAVSEGPGELPGPREILWRRLRRRRTPPPPGILQILVRTLMLSSLQSTNRVRAEADLYLHAPVDAYGIFEFGAMDRIAQAGYEYALPLLAEWQAR